MSDHTIVTPSFRPQHRRIAWVLGATFLLVLSLATGLLVIPKKPPSLSILAMARLQEDYGKVPLSFEINQGQVYEQVKFLTRTQGQSLYLTQTEAVITLPAKAEAKTKSSAVRMSLANANAQARISGEKLLEGKTNYFLGNDPNQWRTNIPTYACVKYEGVYPGVDLVYYGNQQQLEYDFIVAPKADPQIIKMRFDGADELRIDERGDLLITTPTGTLKQHKPFVYQETNGQRQEIAGQYVIEESQQIRFAVGDYDVSKPLVIDPVLSYSTFLGATKGSDSGTAIAVDAAGCAYITGNNSSDIAYTPGAYHPTFKPDDRVDRMQAIFVMKLNPSGTAPIYTALIGGTTGYSYPREGGSPEDPPLYELSNTSQGIAVDLFGNAYVIGRTVSKNFPITDNAFRKTSVGFIENQNYTIDGVVFKLNASGSQLDYSTYFALSSANIPSNASAVRAES